VGDKRENDRRARAAEAIGLAIIALLILAITLVRYGRVLHWSGR
jgi:hypothetical protein